MEEKIEVGEWIRSKDGFIGKVQKINYDNMEKSNYYICEKDNVMASNYLENIAKHSKQLIDLIECGDYVNGYRVENVINEEPCPSWKCVDIDSSKDSSECTLWENDIQTILTKEQYMANCYKVGGEDEQKIL